MAHARVAQERRRAVLHVQQPLGEAVMEQQLGAVGAPAAGEEGRQRGEAHAELRGGERRVACVRAAEQLSLGEWPPRRQHHVEQRPRRRELAPPEQPLAQPQIEAVERAGDVTDLAQPDEVLRHPVQHALQVQEAAVALDVQLVEHVGGVATQVPPQRWLAVQPAQDVLLDVAHHCRLAQVVQRQLAEAGEEPRDGAAVLARGTHEEEPRGEEAGLRGQQLRDRHAPAGLSARRLTLVRRLEIRLINRVDEDEQVLLRRLDAEEGEEDGRLEGAVGVPVRRRQRVHHVRLFQLVCVAVHQAGPRDHRRQTLDEVRERQRLDVVRLAEVVRQQAGVQCPLAAGGCAGRPNELAAERRLAAAWAARHQHAGRHAGRRTAWLQAVRQLAERPFAAVERLALQQTGRHRTRHEGAPHHFLMIHLNRSQTEKRTIVYVCT